jgi:RNA recognition motif-containing protein
MYDKYSGRSRRFAFVTMKTIEDAKAAAEKLNGTVSFIACRVYKIYSKIATVHSIISVFYKTYELHVFTTANWRARD